MPCIRKTFFLPVFIILSVIFSTTVKAVETSLPAGILIGDQDGISVGTDGAYFIDAVGLSAGDVITKRLTIRNTEPYSFNITMTAEPLEESGPLRLLDEVRLTLMLDGSILYDGRVRGDGEPNMIEGSLDLGGYNSGDVRVMDITLTVNPDMKKYYYRGSEAFFRWNFYAARAENPEGPKTGELVRYSLYALISVMAAVMVILPLAGKSKEQRTEG